VKVVSGSEGKVWLLGEIVCGGSVSGVVRSAVAIATNLAEAGRTTPDTALRR
jgi:hypothetical protein